MLKKILASIVLVGSLSACSTTYTQSAPASDGGLFVSGSYDNDAAIFHCPSSPHEGDCERIDIEIK